MQSFEMTPTDELLTVKEAAALLKVSTKTIFRYLKSGLLKSYKVGFSRINRIRKSDVLKLLNENFRV